MLEALIGTDHGWDVIEALVEHRIATEGIEPPQWFRDRREEKNFFEMEMRRLQDQRAQEAYRLGILNGRGSAR